MVAFWSYLVDSGRFESIVHFFPTPGHTMLPSDQDFGHIEVYVRKHVQVVYTPEQWVEIIRKSCSRKPFHVYHMVQSDFVSFNALCKHFVFRKLNEDKNPVKFKETVTFEITQEQPTKLKVQHSYSGYKETVNLSPRGQHFIGSPKSAIFPNKYYTTRIIDARKMKDLQSLKLYIPQVYYESYYNKLKTGNRPEGELDDAEDGSDME